MTSNPIHKNGCIGFFMETSFHYEVYRNIIAELLKKKVPCELIINDLIEQEFVDEMMHSLANINIPDLGCMLFSATLNTSKKYSCIVSPYYTRNIDRLSSIHIRTIYGLAKNQWNHAPWNEAYSAILCYSHYTKKSLSSANNTFAVGNPRFDDWHNKNFASELPAELKIHKKKPTILYAPTYGTLSSIIPWAEKLGRLSHEYNIITKLHHGTLYKKPEALALKTARRHLSNIVAHSDITFSLLAHADYVITDNSGFIFDAINADKKVILLNWPGMDSLLADKTCLSTIDSPEQQVRAFLPVARDMSDIRTYLSPDYAWQQHSEKLRYVKEEYCDAFNDGMAGYRAAQVIIDTAYAV